MKTLFFTCIYLQKFEMGHLVKITKKDVFVCVLILITAKKNKFILNNMHLFYDLFKK